LVIQHSHEEWPELDDLLINDVDFFSYVALPEREIKKLMASLHPPSFAQVMLSLRGWQTLKEVATQVDILIIGSFMASGT
jgi:hypothetical protein